MIQCEPKHVAVLYKQGYIFIFAPRILKIH